MYVLIEKNTNFIGVYDEMQPILDRLNLSRTTFTRKIKSGTWETDKFLIRKPDYVQKKSARGQKRGKMVYFTRIDEPFYDY